MPYAPERTAPGSAEICPAFTSHFTWVAKQVSTGSFAVSTTYFKRFLTWPPPSSPCSKQRITLPFNSSLCSFRIFASVSSMAVWASWPQAWDTPSFLDTQILSLHRFFGFSGIGSASISARRSTVFPGLPPWIWPMMPPSGICTYSIPMESSSLQINFSVSNSSPATSGFS